jgi:predicted nucleic acid-binding Zn ribbon protein
MCDFSGKLIAWVDRELPESEASDVEGHIAACVECRHRLAVYQQASSAFEAYCEATFAAETRRKLPRWTIAVCGAGAIATAVAIAALLMLPRERVAQVPARVMPPAKMLDTPPAPTQANLPVEAAQTPVIPIKRVHHRYVAVPARTQHTTAAVGSQISPGQGVSPFPAEPAVEIAISADAMFAPGAVPPGMSFTAELTIAADGTAERLGLHPRLSGFQRRTNQP